jgi:hypothetical protein
MRPLLVDTYAITPSGFNWDVRRRDSPMFNDSKVGISLDLTIKICLWESSSGEVYIAVFPEGPGPFHFIVHPGHRDLEGEMLAWAEAHLAENIGDNRARLLTLVNTYDAVRKTMLDLQGYISTDTFEVIRRKPLRD